MPSKFAFARANQLQPNVRGPWVEGFVSVPWIRSISASFQFRYRCALQSRLAASAARAAIAIFAAITIDAPSAIADNPFRQLGAAPSETKATWLRDCRVTHEVNLNAPQTQEIEIITNVSNVSAPQLDFSLPNWRPGRYEILDLAGSVRDVSAANEAGQSLKITKLDKATWRVATAASREVRFRYRLYCSELGQRARHVDDTHAFLSGSTVFMQVLSLRDTPQRVVVHTPANWRISSGLDAVDGAAMELIAPNYDALVDAPLEIGTHLIREFEVEGKPFELAIWGHAAYDADRLVRDLTTLSAAQIQFWKDAPFGRYVYLLHIANNIGGGTEHLNSTIMQVGPNRFSPEKEYRKFLSLVSHEFFHTWNVKALRPAGISPYDFQRENYCDLLWVAEGTTSYYEDLLLVRAGLFKPEQYFKNLAESLDEYYRRPGRRSQSVAAAAFDAWTDHTIPSGNAENTTVSIYREGALATLALDMELRRRSDGRVSFDDVLRALYQRFPLGGPGYTQADLQNTCEELGGGDFTEFFQRYITGVEEFPIEEALSVVGIKVIEKADDDDEDDGASAASQPTSTPTSAAASSSPSSAPTAPKPRAYLGIETKATDGLARVTVVRSDGPAYADGVQVDDLLIAINDRRARSDELKTRLREFEPGEAITLTLLRRDQLRTITLTLGGKPDIKRKLERVKNPTAAQANAYAIWLGQPWPSADSQPSEK